MGGFMSCIALNLCECAACMACSCCTSLINATLAQAARFGHLLVLLATFTIAIILGQSYPNDINGYNYYTKIDLTGDCDGNYLENCIYSQLIYRASFACFMLFIFLMLVTAVSEYVNRSLWVLKFGVAIGAFISFWWVDNSFFSGYAEFARVMSFFWLLIQGLLLIDFCHDAHDLLMNQKSDDDQPPYAVYIGSSIAGLSLAILGLVYLFMDYSGCGLGLFFTILTLVFGIATIAASLTEAVGKGLLTPCLMFAYSVFMCWYALLSSPDDECNPTADYVKGSGQLTAIIVVGVVSVIILLYCVGNGTKILNVLNPEGEGVMASYNESPGQFNGVITEQPQASESGKKSDNQDEGENTEKTENKSSGTPHERAFYHLLLALVRTESNNVFRLL